MTAGEKQTSPACYIITKIFWNNFYFLVVLNSFGGIKKVKSGEKKNIFPKDLG